MHPACSTILSTYISLARKILVKNLAVTLKAVAPVLLTNEAVLAPEMLLIESSELQGAIKRKVVEPICQPSRNPAIMILTPLDKWILTSLCAWLAVIASGKHCNVEQVTIGGFGLVIHETRFFVEQVIMQTGISCRL